VPNVNGLTVNTLEAGTQGRPLVLLLHGFPNLGYSWRKMMPAIADAGYYVIAPDCRGFGRTVGWDRLDAEFAKLKPPRRDYQEYWASKQADDDMKHMPQNMSDFSARFIT
jgi:pimeloyl-ACP methyl ester carboxylesterase